MRLLIATALFALSTAAAHAGADHKHLTAPSGSAAAAASSATAGAQASNRTRVSNSAAAQGGAAYGGQGGYGGAGGSIGDIAVSNRTNYPRQAAPAFAAPITSFNPCSGAGVSAGVQAPLFGLSAASQSYDDACRLHQLGMDAAAKELLCQTRSIRDAIYYAALQRQGMPCLADLQKLNKTFAEYGQPTVTPVGPLP